MLKSRKLTSPSSDRVRWGVSIVTPIIALILIFFLFKISHKSAIREEAPDLELSYVVLTPQKVSKPKPTPPKPKRVVKKVVKKVVKAPTPKTDVAKVEESKPSETVAEIKAGAEKVIEAEPAPVVEEAQPFLNIKSTSELDNTSFSPIYNPKPAYPAIARKNRITGYVVVDLTINKKGRVKDFTIVKILGHPKFGTELKKVLLKWRFPPPRVKGKSVAVIYRYRVNYKLN